MTRASPRERRAAFLVLFALQGLVAWIFLRDTTPGTTAAWTGFPLDDAWIHLVYARSLAGGLGFAYNGAAQEAGASSPLWAMLLAPLFWLKALWGGSIVAGVKTLGFAFGVATTWTAFRLGDHLGGRSAAWCAGLLIAVDPHLTFSKLSGMEVPAATFVVLAIGWCVATERWRLFSVALALAPLARPELALVPALGAGLFAIVASRARFPRETWVRAALLGLPCALTVGAWGVFCRVVTGRWLPNTYYAKRLQHVGLVDLDNFRVLVDMVFDLSPMLLGCAFWCYLAGAVKLLREEHPPRERALRAGVAVFPLVFLLALGRSHALGQPWPFYWHRYLEPVVPALYLVVGVCLGGLFAQVRRTRYAVLGVLAALGLVARLPFFTPLLAHRFAGNCENINEMNVALGRWAAQHVPPERWIATNDAGAVRYFSHRPTLDVVGLNDHRVLQGGLPDVFRSTQPVVFIGFAQSLPGGPDGPWGPPELTVRAGKYTICDCPGQREMLVYPRRDVRPVF